MVLRGYVVCSSRSAAFFAAPAMPAQALQFLRRMGGRSPLRPLLLRSGLLASRALQKCTAEAAVSARIGSRLPAREKRNLKKTKRGNGKR